VKSGLLAARGCVVRPRDGIVDLTAEQTMRNLDKITQKGLVGMDQAILDIMLPRCRQLLAHMFKTRANFRHHVYFPAACKINSTARRGPPRTRNRSPAAAAS
jgi:hypothetical protein